MKLKFLIPFLLLPLSLFAQSTNKIDTLWVPTAIRYSASPTANYVLKGDASGNLSFTPATNALTAAAYLSKTANDSGPFNYTLGGLIISNRIDTTQSILQDSSANTTLDFQNKILKGGWSITNNLTYLGSSVINGSNTAKLTNFTLIQGTTIYGSASNMTLIPAANLFGNVGVSNLNGGTGSSATTYWQGDGTWGTPSGGNVSSNNVTAWSTNNLFNTTIGVGNALRTMTLPNAPLCVIDNRANFQGPWFIDPLGTSCVYIGKTNAELTGTVEICGGTVSSLYCIGQAFVIDTGSGQPWCTIPASVGSATTWGAAANGVHNFAGTNGITVLKFVVGASGTAITNSVMGSYATTIPAITAGTGFQTNVTLTGATVGTPIIVGCSIYTATVIPAAYCLTNDQATIVFENTGLVTAQTPGALTVNLRTITP